MSALDATIQKRREELQELKRKNAVEMESMKTKAAEATVKAEEEHERKVTVARLCPGETRRSRACSARGTGR